MFSVVCILLSSIAFVAQPSYSIDADSIAVDRVDDADVRPMFLNAPDDAATTRSKASVRPMAGNVRSNAGFLQVDPKFEAKLFYWFFESQQNPTDRPLVLWLYGEPGRSSMLSVFEENGPYKLQVNDKVVLHEHSWTKAYNMLYVDSTVGAGFSSANSTAAYPRTSAQAAGHLYVALKEFMRIYDDYQKVPVYVAGEYYAAKIVIALAARIHRENADAKTPKVNLAAVCIGAPFIDPANQQRRADFLYQMGVVDVNDRAAIASHEADAQKAMADRQYGKAKSHSGAVDAKIKKAGYWPPIDALDPQLDLSSVRRTVDFMRTKKVAQEVHAGDATFADDRRAVLKFVGHDLNHTSAAAQLEKLLHDYKVLVYGGQYDMVVPTSQIDSVVGHLPWHQLDEFQQQKRQNLWDNGALIGYSKCLGPLCQVMVRQANHFVTRSQPSRTMKAVSIVTNV